ncbi:ATP synthase F1 subunit gamma [Fundicoccus culcitae]|uniref:ATP synthase gamma chain n=1 Tax=Fundicoccus culcitae TaxID=2969821 RepID=A0ABY5P5Z0_9LACT|nr:ATP synthase F1 subunit gamma [Fundicoccus culcitae]UUX33991.1 ATP synthase F1 subunit gamma [Fundicoccus culcitae]
MSLNELKKRMDSTSKTAQITKAMQMVSAAKYHKLVGVANNYFTYSTVLRRMVARLAKYQFDLLDDGVPMDVDEANFVDFHDFLIERPVKKVGYLVISSDKGLAGGYNSSVIRSMEQLLERDHKDKQEVVILAIGNPIAKYCRDQGYEVVFEQHDLSDYPNFTEVQLIMRKAVDLYKEQVFDALYVCYNHHLSALKSQFRADQILPLSEVDMADELAVAPTNREVLIEPSQTDVLDVLLPQYAESQIYGAIIDAKTAEHASRMNAMRSATDNAHEMIADLKQQYNQERQIKVTDEIIEIINGANALNNKQEEGNR